jgi:hypothetical protein
MLDAERGQYSEPKHSLIMQMSAVYPTSPPQSRAEQISTSFLVSALRQKWSFSEIVVE